MHFSIFYLHWERVKRFFYKSYSPCRNRFAKLLAGGGEDYYHTL